MKKAIVLLSGGLDSATVLAIAQTQGFDCYCLSFRYGQRHSPELEASRRIAQNRHVTRHEILDIDLSLFGGSALTDDIPVPRNRSEEELSESIPVTYVPARNTVFLSLGLAWAEALGAHDIFIGVNALDYSGYPDCRPEFIESFETTANLGTKAGIEGNGFTIHAPLIRKSKAEIIRKGIELGVDYRLTLSCYNPSPRGEACGECDSCQLRRKGFEKAGVKDPTQYQKQ